MYRRAGRFVQHEDVIVFVQDNVAQRRHFLQMRRYGIFFTFGYAHRRNTHLIAGLQLILRLDALFIYPHLALTQDAINHTLRSPF